MLARQRRGTEGIGRERDRRGIAGALAGHRLRIGAAAVERGAHGAARLAGRFPRGAEAAVAIVTRDATSGCPARQHADQQSVGWIPQARAG